MTGSVPSYPTLWDICTLPESLETTWIRCTPVDRLENEKRPAAFETV